MRHIVLLAALASSPGLSQLPPQIRFQPGPVNSVLVGSDVAVYGVQARTTSVKKLLLTHARRDSIGMIPMDSTVIAPAAELELFTEPGKFWDTFETARFHDYAQRTTKVPIRAFGSVQAVSDGQEIAVSEVRIKAIETPGYTPGAVSYVIEAGGKRIICTGDLIYGDGKILDLYSLQDAIPEAKARGYHGYAARAVSLIASLRKVAALKPDVLIPSRGPIITNPQQSIALLISRLQAFLKSHFETDALRWYWGDDNHRIRSRAVEAPLRVLSMSEQSKLPPDILAIGNSRLILSKSGSAFLVDAGYSKTLPELQRMRAEGRIRGVDGIWITHYHDDHTDYVNDVVQAFQSPVYFTKAMTEVLGRPGAFRLPCLPTRAIPADNEKADGETLRWHEWQLTFWNFPGQTLYHGGLVARRDDGQTYLFVGDSFTPSGMDDYCMQNRDFLRKGAGYDYCLRKISSLPKNTWLLNQHVQPMFRYTTEQIARMQSELEKRSTILREMSPWPDINYMVDESWARMYPYGSETKRGEPVSLTLRISNHAPSRATYQVKWNVPEGWQTAELQESVTIAAGGEGQVKATFRPSSSGLFIVTADVKFGSHSLREWTEAMVRVR